MVSLSIIMPALNEEEAIARAIEAVPLQELEKRGYLPEILVVDNGSTDRTFEIASLCGARVIREPRKGYGQALRTGFANTHADIIVTCDADNTYPVADIPQLVSYILDNHIDFLTTDRFHYPTDDSMSTRNFIGNELITWVANMLFSIDLKDSQSGMWVFRRPILERMTIRSWNNTLSQEVKIEAISYVKAKCFEMPIHYYPRVGNSQLYGSTYKAVKGGAVLMLGLLSKKIRR